MSPSDHFHALPVNLPATFWQAAKRGVRCRCPRCGGGELFGKWLKPVERCRTCGQDWTHARADDVPAYISILLTGHLLAPLIIFLFADLDLSLWAAAAIIFPLATGMVIGGLQPIKGAVIALQWWLGMFGFKRERPAEATPALPDTQ
ncbi:DUF983 domain-containing protein [Tsuneonella mangrovi]|uniref:DUF983 domain-containing protein n=1 Tax=Tsuneonella mangrovi TaxID=1982042 RepID=UPI000BA1F788|nr:DUF983 domain-containing protein [Tsuneonella mangrovi]